MREKLQTIVEPVFRTSRQTAWRQYGLWVLAALLLCGSAARVASDCDWLEGETPQCDSYWELPPELCELFNCDYYTGSDWDCCCMYYNQYTAPQCCDYKCFEAWCGGSEQCAGGWGINRYSGVRYPLWNCATSGQNAGNCVQ